MKTKMTLNTFKKTLVMCKLKKEPLERFSTIYLEFFKGSSENFPLSVDVYTSGFVIKIFPLTNEPLNNTRGRVLALRVREFMQRVDLDDFTENQDIHIIKRHRQVVIQISNLNLDLLFEVINTIYKKIGISSLNLYET